MGVGSNQNLRNNGNIFFSLKSYGKLLVFVSVRFLLVLNIESHLISELEVEHTFPRFPRFRFLVSILHKIEKSDLSEIFIFSPKSYRNLFCLHQFIALVYFLMLSYNYCQKLKWQTNFQDFPVFNFGYMTKLKTWKPWKCSFFFINHIIKFKF